MSKNTALDSSLLTSCEEGEKERKGIDDQSDYMRLRLESRDNNFKAQVNSICIFMMVR